MEFMSRGSRPNQSSNQTTGSTSGGNGVGTVPSSASPSKSRKPGFNIFHISSFALLLSITILIAAVAGLLSLGGPANEFKNVDQSKLQAVFLNGGQVYFGRITNLNENFMKVRDIYYLRIEQQVQPDTNNTQQQGSPVLVKLGCELHRPQNEMVINREQVVFWENLKDDTAENTVPGAVKKYVEANPNGQDCAQQSGQTNTNTTTETTPPAATPPTATPPATTTPRR